MAKPSVIEASSSKLKVKKSKKSAPVVRIASPVPSSSSSSKSDASSSSSDSETDDEEDNDDGTTSNDKGKSKEKSKSRSVIKYTPLEGYTPRVYGNIKAEEGAESFNSGIDWEELDDDPQLELWAVRVPDGMKPKYLEGLTLQLPPASTTVSTPKIGQVTAKKVAYDVILVDEEGGKRKRDETVVENVTGGEELKALIPLLSKRSTGDKLYVAPRPIARHVIITRSLPDSVLSYRPSATSSLVAQPVTKKQKKVEVIAQKSGRVQPAGLKFRLCLAGMGVGSGTINPLNRVAPVIVEKDVEMMDDEVKIEAEVKEEETEEKVREKKQKRKEKKESKKEKKIAS